MREPFDVDKKQYKIEVIQDDGFDTDEPFIILNRKDWDQLFMWFTSLARTSKEAVPNVPLWHMTIRSYEDYDA